MHFLLETKSVRMSRENSLTKLQPVPIPAYDSMLNAPPFQISLRTGS